MVASTTGVGDCIGQVSIAYANPLAMLNAVQHHFCWTTLLSISKYALKNVLVQNFFSWKIVAIVFKND